MAAAQADAAPRESRHQVNGVELAVCEWPGEDPAVLFVHATGFHARCWDQVVARLPGRHCFAVDVRGHGRSEKPPPPYSWPEMSTDITELVRTLGLQGAVGVGHSMGGYLVTVAAAARPEAFGRLLLVDPTIGPPRRAAAIPEAAASGFVAKRRNEWSSPQEMVERFRARPPFSLWDPAVLIDYCTFGLLPNPAGDGFVLACPPEVEAAVYAGMTAYDVYQDVERITIPVRVLRARQREANPAPGGMVDMSASPTAPDLTQHFRRGEDVPLPDLSHFIPMQAPETVAQHVLSLLDQA